MTLLAIVVIAAGVVPACLAEECCAKTDESTVHRQMPCCDQSTITAREVVRVLPGTSTAPQVTLPAIATESPSGLVPPRVQTHLMGSRVHEEPDPPLFLLNEQFLI